MMITQVVPCEQKTSQFAAKVNLESADVPQKISYVKSLAESLEENAALPEQSIIRRSNNRQDVVKFQLHPFPVVSVVFGQHGDREL
jgi:hypothetical protein